MKIYDYVFSTYISLKQKKGKVIPFTFFLKNTYIGKSKVNETPLFPNLKRSLKISEKRLGPGGAVILWIEVQVFSIFFFKAVRLDSSAGTLWLERLKALLKLSNAWRVTSFSPIKI